MLRFSDLPKSMKAIDVEASSTIIDNIPPRHNTPC